MIHFTTALPLNWVHVSIPFSCFLAFVGFLFISTSTPLTSSLVALLLLLLLLRLLLLYVFLFILRFL